MSKHYIINDAAFGKIKDLTIRGEALKHFINHVVYKHPNWDILLQNLSDIYVLVASLDDQNLLKDGEKSWKEIMKKDEYDILEKNHNFVLSYMLVEEKHKYIHYIGLFDTISRNNNLGSVMIKKYERNNYNVNLIPQYIIYGSAKYWAKVLNIYCYDYDEDKYTITQKDINDFIDENNLNPTELRWEHLYELCN